MVDWMIGLVNGCKDKWLNETLLLLLLLLLPLTSYPAKGGQALTNYPAKGGQALTNYHSLFHQLTLTIK